MRWKKIHLRFSHNKPFVRRVDPKLMKSLMNGKSPQDPAIKPFSTLNWDIISQQNSRFGSLSDRSHHQGFHIANLKCCVLHVWWDERKSPAMRIFIQTRRYDLWQEIRNPQTLVTSRLHSLAFICIYTRRNFSYHWLLLNCPKPNDLRFDISNFN